MKIKITDDRQEMAKIGRDLARLTRADLSSDKYKDYRDDMDILYPKFGGDTEVKEDALYAWLYDFWVYGVNVREEYFYDFPHKSHEEKSKYITRSNRFRYYEMLNNREDSRIIKHKYKTYEKFGKYFGRDVIEITKEDDFGKYSAFVDKHPKFIVKPDNLGLGMGIYIVESENENKRILFENFLKEINKNKNKSEEDESSIVLEELIVQEDAFAKLYPKAVNIIRLTTIMYDSSPRYLDAWLRVGMGGYDITAANLAEIYCGVDLNTGIVATDGFTELYGSYECHPDTNIRFKGYQIPRWNELLHITAEMAHVLPSVQYIGWDMALTDKGWVLVEGNENGEFLGQLVFNKPYKEMLNEMLGVKDEQGFWWEKRPRWV